MSKRGLIWPLSAFLIALLARRWLDVVEVRGRSMAPTLIPGDRLLVMRQRNARVDDVVLAADPRQPGRELIKRIVGVGSAGVTLRGDNVAASTDARTFGVVPRAAVGWRAVLRYWPVDRIGRIPSAPSGAAAGHRNRVDALR